jgi:hopanoid biosynthesis associated radical SAM protein HpnH
MGLYIGCNRLAGRKFFPMVLMLEPLHACNLHCAGCGRIREYADTVNERMSLDECINAVKECASPTVSICGGEPLIYPEIVALTDYIIREGRHIYLCTNGQCLSERLPDFTAVAKRNKRFWKHLFWNVHLDGMSATHDAITGKTGSFDKAVEGIRDAKKLGYYVYTNTTLYSQTTVDELVELGKVLMELKVDGMMIAPAYGYEAVQDNSIFITREQTYAKFREIRSRMQGFRLTTTPTFMDFLCGERELTCAAWANPTRNIRGWKSPCYLLTDKHCATYKELIEATDWSRIGHNNDPRCEHCLMHCGFEPAAVLCANGVSDVFRLAKWQFGGFIKSKQS